jgi:uncharacterized protein YkwD
MRRYIRWPLLVASCVALAATYAGAALATPQSAVQVTSGASTVYLPLLTTIPPTFAQQVVNLINQERTAHGCQPFNVAPQLSAAAQAHSQDMALHDFVSHTGSGGTSPSERLTRAGYNWRMMAENIAAGQSTPEAVVASWMSSSGHRDNILICALHDIGIGYYYQPDDQPNVQLSNGQTSGPFRFYWTQDFGSH